MPPKNQTNGFWLFAQSQKQQFRRQGLLCDTNERLLTLAGALWKQLSKDEKSQWDLTAKEQRKSKSKGLDRLDNVGNRLADRKDPAEEARKRREQEISSVTAKWFGKDLTRERFYMINYQHMVFVAEGESMTEGMWFPRELAMLEYTLKEGIMKTYHQLIWPEYIPEGYRFQAHDHSESTHKIPPEQMKEYDDSSDFRKIWQKMLDIVKDGIEDGQYPPLYCLTRDYERVKFMTDWLWERSGASQRYDNPLCKVYSLEEMVASLLSFSGHEETVRIKPTSIATQLDSSQWDYTPNTVCEYHNHVDVSRYCALASVRKCVYAISDMLALYFDFELTPSHVPTYDKSTVQPVGRLIPLDVMGWSRREAGKKGRGGRGAAGGIRRSTMNNDRSDAASTASFLSDDEDESVTCDDATEDDIEGEIKPVTCYGDALRSRGGGSMRGGRAWSQSAGPALAPVSGQFRDADWPTLGGGAPSKPTSGAWQSEGSLSKGVAGMSLSDTASGGMPPFGRGTSEDLSVSPAAVWPVRPPPGFALGAGRGHYLVEEAQGVGRGNPRPSCQPPLAKPQEPDSLLFMAQPVLGATAAPLGRGTRPVPVGRGSKPKADDEVSGALGQNSADRSDWGMLSMEAMDGSVYQGGHSMQGGGGVNAGNAKGQAAVRVGRGFAPTKDSGNDRAS